MANIKISELSEVTELSEDAVIPVVQDSATGKSTLSQLGNLIANDIYYEDLQTRDITLVGAINYLVTNMQPVQSDWSQTSRGELDYIKNKPTGVSAFNNDVGYITAAEAPVQSVNGATGTVVLDGDDIDYSEGVTVNDKIDTISTALNKINDLYVISGFDQASTSGTTVNFGVTFSSPPHVVVTPFNSSSPASYIRSCVVSNVTTTQFTFYEMAISNNLDSLIEGSDYCYWIAVGTKA